MTHQNSGRTRLELQNPNTQYSALTTSLHCSLVLDYTIWDIVSCISLCKFPLQCTTIKKKIPTQIWNVLPFIILNIHVMVCCCWWPVSCSTGCIHEILLFGRHWLLTCSWKICTVDFTGNSSCLKLFWPLPLSLRTPRDKIEKDR